MLTRVHVRVLVVHENIDQTLVNSLHGLLNFEIGGLYCHAITTEYKTRVHIYSVVSGQDSYTIDGVIETKSPVIVNC